MASTTETETKLILDPKDAPWLFQGCKLVRRVEQLNVYYDSHWRLLEGDATFRVRLQPGSAPVMALKVTKAWDKDKGKRVAEEVECAFEKGTRLSVLVPRILTGRTLPSELRHALENLGVLRTLTRVGWVRNVRHVLGVPGGGTFELDEMRYPTGDKCVEVEVEGQAIEKHLLTVAWVKARAPSARPSTLSKYRRMNRYVGPDLLPPDNLHSLNL